MRLEKHKILDKVKTSALFNLNNALVFHMLLGIVH